MATREDRKTERELRKAVTRALKRAEDSIQREPRVTVMFGRSDNELACPVEEITSWLFKRRDDNGNPGN